MKKEFIGHFKRSAGEIDDIWKTANFVFDANVLLNLYRYSNDTRDDFLNFFDTVKGRIWQPEQVGYEFLNNRPRVISEQSKAYAAAIKSVEDLSNSFSEERAHPFISHQVKTAYDNAAKAIKDEMKKNQAAQDKLLTEDDILDKISVLFEGKVGAAYSADQMSTAFKDGEARYAQKTPPGYMDEKKFKEPKNDFEKRSNFGDWILWRQLMDFANASKKPVILVTNDTKEDWWLEKSGKTLGPRPELIAEFFAETGQHILIYKPERSLDLGKEKLQAKVDDKSIAEVSSEREARERSSQERMSNEKSLYEKEIHKNRAWLHGKRKFRNMHGRATFEKEAEWRVESVREELHRIESYLAELRDRENNLQYLFSKAIKAGDHDRVSKIDGQLHEAALERHEVSENLAALREAYERDLKSQSRPDY